jgi:hypothetical protein
MITRGSAAGVQPPRWCPRRPRSSGAADQHDGPALAAVAVLQTHAMNLHKGRLGAGAYAQPAGHEVIAEGDRGQGSA